MEGAIPVVSKAQNMAMHAAAAGRSTIGIPASVGREFVAATPKGAVKHLPKYKKMGTKPKKIRSQPFGSLAPGGAGHYYGTTPIGDDENA